MPQIADVADVFHHAQIGIQAERLGEVAGLRARVARRLCRKFPRCRRWLPSLRRESETWWFCPRRRRRSGRRFRRAATSKRNSAHGFAACHNFFAGRAHRWQLRRIADGRRAMRISGLWRAVLIARSFVRRPGVAARQDFSVRGHAGFREADSLGQLQLSRRRLASRDRRENKYFRA